MPTIPLNNWGNAVADLAPDPQFASRDPKAFITDSGLAEARAVSHSSANVTQEASRIALVQSQLAKEAEAENKRTMLLSQSIQAKHDQLQIQEQSQQKIRELSINDTLTPEQKRQTYNQFYDGLTGQYANKYSQPAVAGAFQNATEEVKARHSNELDQAIFKNTESQNAANLLGSFDVLSRMATDDPVTAAKQMEGLARTSGRAAGWDPATIEKVVEKQRQDYFATHVTSLLNNDPAGALKALTSGQFPELDPDKRLILTKEAGAAVDRIQARADRAYDAQIRIGERAINNLSQIYGAGAVPPPEMLNRVASMVKGTELEPEFKALAATVEDSAKFASKSIPDQLAEVAALQKTANNPSQGATLGEARQIQWKAKQVDATVKAFNADPMGTAEANGVVKLAPLDPSTPQALGHSLGARMQEAEIASAWAGVPVSPLKKGETEGLAHVLNTQTPEAQKVYLQGMALAINDPTKLNAMLTDVAKNHGALASAGRLLADSDPNAQRAGDLILRGESYLNPQPGEKQKHKLLEMPSETGATGFQAKFDEGTKGVYDGKAPARDLDYRNTLRIYAALAAQDGVYAGKVDKVDDDRFQKALDLATGGIEDYKGRNIQLPRGVTRDELDHTVTQQLDVLHDSHALTGDLSKGELHTLPLQNTAQNGRYGYYVLNGNHWLLDKHGYPVFIDPNPPSWTPNAQDLRSDGSRKGTGWLGVLKRPDGKVSSELSVGVNIGGKEVEIPTLVPTLSKEEVKSLLSLDPSNPQAIPQPIIDKAIAHAKPLLEKGLSPFKP